MQTFKKYTLRAALVCMALTVLCGLVYPLLITGISQLAFGEKAGGSIIQVNGKKYGSTLLAQQFTGSEYLWGRIMNLNTATFFNDAGAPLLYSGPSNKTPAGEELEQLVAERVKKLEAAHPGQAGRPIPVDLVTCSGSGLDPHISPAAAEYQVGRIAAARGISEAEVRAVVKKYTAGRLLGVFGEPTVNVLQVNLALDGILQ